MGGCCSADDIDTQYVNIEPVKSPSAVIEKNHLLFDQEDIIITNEIFKKKKLGWSMNAKQCKFQNILIENGSLQSDCICIQRLSFILSKYDKYFLSEPNEYYSAYRFIHADFGKYYSQSNLLNDYIHLLRYHSNSKIQQIQTTNDEKNNIKADLFNITTDCRSNECNAVRSILDIDYSDSDLSDIQDIVSKHILDIIHSNLYHSDYIQSQLNSNKFVTNGICGVATKNTRKNTRKSEPLNYYQITPCFEYSTSSYSHYSIFNNNKPITLQRKYSNLKQEIIENELFSLSINEWNFITYKAEKYLNTVCMKEIKMSRSIEHNYDINSLFTGYSFERHLELNHILCLLLLSDFNELAISLRSSYLKQSVKESDEILAKRHANYWNFARILKITVELFGIVRSEYDKRDETMDGALWHCITVPKTTIIPWLKVKWSFPISTTKNLKVLNDAREGIIVALDQYDVCGFDCGWISKFQFEKEILLIDYKRCYGYNLRSSSNSWEKKTIITNPLPIHYIIDNKDSLKDIDANKDYIRSIHGFIQIMNTERLLNYGMSSDIPEWFGRPNYKWKNHFDALQKYEKNMVNLIQTKFKNIKKGSVYAKNAIDTYFKNKTEFTIDFRLQHQEHRFLSDLFCVRIKRQDQMDNDQKDVDKEEELKRKIEGMKDNLDIFAVMDIAKTMENIDNNRFYKRINIQFICYLFPNCKKLKIYNIKELGDIDEAFMEWLFNELKQIKESRDESDNHQNEKHELLINGYIRIYQDELMIAEDIIDLILLYYPKTRNKIETISFMECMNDSAQQSMIKMKDFMPTDWKIEAKKTTYSNVHINDSLLISLKK